MRKICLCLLMLTGCAAVPPVPVSVAANVADDGRALNRLTWGLNDADMRAVRAHGLAAWTRCMASRRPTAIRSRPPRGTAPASSTCVSRSRAPSAPATRACSRRKDRNRRSGRPSPNWPTRCTTSRSKAALPLAAAGTRLWAAPNADARLLFVFLRGGYDATSLLVPVASQFYYESRPNIAIARPGAELNTALPLDADWGLHPALRDSIYPLFQAGQAAFIPFAGIDDLSRSHFETQDSIEMGQPLTGRRDYRSGFLNRLADVLQGAHPIAFTDQLPLAMQGGLQVPNAALRNLAKPAIDAHMAGEMEAANRNAISAKGFELEARRIARLMKGQIHARLRRRGRLGYPRGARRRLYGLNGAQLSQVFSGVAPRDLSLV